MLPDDTFLFVYSSKWVGLRLGGLRRKQERNVFNNLADLEMALPEIWGV